MANIFCSKTYSDLKKLNLNEFNDIETENDWSIHLVKIGKIKKIVFLHHASFLNIFFDNDTEIEKYFYDVLFSQINSFYKLNESDNQTIQKNIGNFRFFKKSENRKINNYIKKLSTIIKSTNSLNDDFFNFDNGIFNEDSIDKFLKIYLKNHPTKK